MPIIISDHPDPDVDFYVPPGTDSTQAFQEAMLLSKVYGVAHLLVRGRLYIYASDLQRKGLRGRKASPRG